MRQTKIVKKCEWCNKEFEGYIKHNRKFCGRSCSASHRNLNREWKESSKLKISKSNKGKLSGENNPNFGGKYTHQPEVYKKICEGNKVRGLQWTDEHRQKHSKKMLGDSNWMRGKTHSIEVKNLMSEIKIRQYKNGEIEIKRINMSRAEKEILKFLIDNNINAEKQFKIDGVTYIYDIYVPTKKMIIEYNGDYWHANPKIYASDWFNKSKKLYANEIWDRDKTKKLLAEECGYDFLVVWENEYKKDKDKVLNNILNKIKEK